MAQITLLTPDQLKERQKKPNPGREERERQIAEWIELLRPAAPGWGGEVRLEQGEDRLKVRRRLRVAAEHLGLSIRFQRVRDKTRMVFDIVDHTPLQTRDSTPSDPAISNSAPTPEEKPKRRSKPKTS